MNRYFNYTFWNLIISVFYWDFRSLRNHQKVFYWEYSLESEEMKVKRKTFLSETGLNWFWTDFLSEYIQLFLPIELTLYGKVFYIIYNLYHQTIEAVLIGYCNIYEQRYVWDIWMLSIFFDCSQIYFKEAIDEIKYWHFYKVESYSFQ